MTVKLATRLAIIGTALGLLLSLLGPFLIEWMLRSMAMSHEAVSLTSRLYYATLTVVSDGSLLLFLVCLYTRQKE